MMPAAFLTFGMGVCVAFLGFVWTQVGEPLPAALGARAPDGQHTAVDELVATHERGGIREEYSLDVSAAAEFRRLAHDAEDMALSLANGDWKYLELLASIEDYRFQEEGRRACGAAFATEIIAACNARFEMVVDRTGPTRGAIVYSRVLEREDALVGGESSDARCPPYVRCLARVRLGGDVNLSGLPAEQERFAVAHELQLVRSLPNLRDPTFLRRLITQWQKELELPDAVPLEPLKVLQRRRLLSFVEYGQERVSVMERGQE